MYWHHVRENSSSPLKKCSHFIFFRFLIKKLSVHYIYYQFIAFTIISLHLLISSFYYQFITISSLHLLSVHCKLSLVHISHCLFNLTSDVILVKEHGCIYGLMNGANSDNDVSIQKMVGRNMVTLTSR